MEIKKREFCFLFFGRQSTGSAGGFDKHRIKKPWPYLPIKNFPLAEYIYDKQIFLDFVNFHANNGKQAQIVKLRKLSFSIPYLV